MNNLQHIIYPLDELADIVKQKKKTHYISKLFMKNIKLLEIP